MRITAAVHISNEIKRHTVVENLLCQQERKPKLSVDNENKLKKTMEVVSFDEICTSKVTSITHYL